MVVESDKPDMDVKTFYDVYLAANVVEEGWVAALLPVESNNNIPDSNPVAIVTKAAAAFSDLGLITPVFQNADKVNFNTSLIYS